MTWRFPACREAVEPKAVTPSPAAAPKSTAPAAKPAEVPTKKDAPAAKPAESKKDMPADVFAPKKDSR